MAEKEEKEYVVASPIIYKKKRYEVDQPVTMDEETGDPLLKQGILKEASAEPEKKAEKAKAAKKPEDGK